MDNKTKYSMVLAGALVTFIFGLTSPTIIIYFASRVSPEVLAIANMTSTGLAALVNSSVKADKILELYKKYFSYIVTFDVVATYVVYACSIDYVAIRYIGMGLISAFSTTLWTLMLKNAVNQHLRGDNLTRFDAFNSSCSLAGSMLGAGLAIFVTNIEITTCLIIQAGGMTILGLVDTHNYKKLTKGDDIEDETERADASSPISGQGGV